MNLPAEPTPDAPAERWRALLSGFPAKAMLVVTVLLGVYLFLRTPTMAGLDVHELGADEGNTVVLLHGYGAPGDDLVPFGEVLLTEIEGLRIVAPEAPHRTGLGGRAWFNGPASQAASVAQIQALLLELEADGSPRSRVVLLGFSQGARLATLVSEREPELAGTALMSGYSRGATLHGRVFVSHGSGDPIISFDGAADFARTAAETAEVTWFAFDGGHTTRPARAALLAWLRDCF